MYIHNYIINLKNSQYYNRFLKIWLILFTFSIFFPIRNVFLTPEALLTGNYSDFTSFSLYLSDILVILGLLFILIPRGIKEFKLKIIDFSLKNPFFWLTIAVLLTFLIHFGLNMRLNVYLLLKWIGLIVAYGTFRVLFDSNELKLIFFRLFAWLAGVQSIIAIFQFCSQASIGLFRLGEQHISPNILGIAKIVSGGTNFVRAYGTFPHPNPFSAFLVAGVFISLYLVFTSSHRKQRILYSTLIFLKILALALTFSRGALIVLVFGLVVFFGVLIFKNYQNGWLRQVTSKWLSWLTVGSVIVILASVAVSVFVLKPFLLTRATFSDQSTADRKFYNSNGIKMTKENPIFGVGLGNSVLHMEQASGKILQPWEKQPPHNYFIITASELGIPAMLILTWVFVLHIFLLLKKLKSESDFKLTSYYLLLTTLFLCFLLLMQFDHYFYTLNQTQLLLWIFLALVSSETNSKSSADDNTGG
jgi:O-antigen ligase